MFPSKVLAYFLLAMVMMQAGCAGPQSPPTPAPEESFKGRGNEPGWAVDIHDGEIILLADYGNVRVVAPAPEPTIAGDTVTYATAADGRPLTVTIVDRLCHDGMSGFPFPKTVTVLFNAQELRGCGGETVELLEGEEWVVDAVNGGVIGAGNGAVSGSRATIRFAPERVVSGQSFCNSYRGQYTLTGESLSFSLTATTRMACTPEIMEQEKAFTEFMAAAERFEMPDKTTLILHTSDDRTVRATR